MVVFLDTSALYALADQDDLHFQEARLLFSRLLGSGDTLLTHSYVLVETAAFVHAQCGGIGMGAGEGGDARFNGDSRPLDWGAWVLSGDWR